MSRSAKSEKRRDTPVEEITGTSVAVTELAETVEWVSNNINDQTQTTSSIATEAAHASKNAATVANALAAFGETISETRHAADISLEISKSLSSGTAEVLEAINRFIRIRGWSQTIEVFPTSNKFRTHTAPARGELSSRSLLRRQKRELRKRCFAPGKGLDRMRTHRAFRTR